MSLKKTAKQESPHAIFENFHGWQWRVLKTYKTAKSEAKDQCARWFCAVSSPMTQGGIDLGDTYKSDVLDNARLVAATDEWLQAYGLRRNLAATIEEYLA